MFKYLALLAIGVLIIFSLNKKEVHVTTIDANDTILAFGDSITYGFGVEEGLDYPSALSDKTGLSVLNAGVNGDTSQDALRRLPALLNEESLKLVLLCFGGNDLLQKTSKESLKSNLRTMIRAFKKQNIAVVLISVPDVSLFGLNSLNLYEELAEEENVELIENLLSHVLSKPSLKSDYVHPNAAGYEYMANEIYDYLKAQAWVK